MVPEDTMQLPLLSVRHIQGISGMSCGSDPCRYNADASRICEINTGNQLYALVPVILEYIMQLLFVPVR